MKKILISRTDGIGDVMLTLPMTGYLKEQFPGVEIFFLGRNYTRPIVECCSNIGQFLSWDVLGAKDLNEQVADIQNLQLDAVIHVFPDKEVAKVMKVANVPIRIGTSHRIVHLLTCNKLVHFSRKHSPLHESQLNFQLLKPLVSNLSFNLDRMYELSGFHAPAKHPEVDLLINKNKKNVIFHPKSKGSAREWGLHNFAELIKLLPSETYNIITTGTEAEGRMFRSTLVQPFSHVCDASGRLSLIQLISLIAHSDALVACSTGPLHIASALGIFTIGIYPPIRPMDPGRWAPIGPKSKVMVKDRECSKCRNNVECTCIIGIDPIDIAEELLEIIK